jgi:hypothetical protein
MDFWHLHFAATRFPGSRDEVEFRPVVLICTNKETVGIERHAIYPGDVHFYTVGGITLMVKFF